MKKGKEFALVRPCAHCPFREDVPGYLRRARAVEIARSLAEGATFPCHETTVADPEDESENVATEDSSFCAGALICLEKEGDANQVMRVAERLGLYDARRLDMGAPVVDSLAAFVWHHDADVIESEEPECCEVCDAGCEAPAGHMVNGMVVPAENSEVELTECEGCGCSACESCMNGETLCPSCLDY